MKAHFCPFSLASNISSAFLNSPYQMFFSSRPGKGSNSCYFGTREGVNSKSWSVHREGSAKQSVLLCAEKGWSQAPCSPQAGKCYMRRGFSPRERQYWHFKAMCVIINILKSNGLKKTVDIFMDQIYTW